MLVDRGGVGESFASWPEETRFITPSFPTNSIVMLDLNSIAIGTSPAYSLESEHPTGREYASYLRQLAQFFNLSVCEGTDVLRISSLDSEFHLHLAEGSLRAKHVVWAAGEFQYPLSNGLPGGEHCRHTATVERYEDLDGDDFIIIGGYESGIDAAYHLANRDKRVRLFDKGCPWLSGSSDPSVSLSTYSLERMNSMRFAKQVELRPNMPITSVDQVGNTYTITTLEGEQFETDTQPLFAGGFQGSQTMVADFFEQRADGFPMLSDDDQSTTTPGLFMCGPAVRHGNQSFCFIYKYRQRFAVVAKAIASSLGLPVEELEVYRMWGMYLDDLSCCGQECVC